MTSIELSTEELAEIAKLVTAIVNPDNYYEANLRYAGGGNVFLYSDETLKDEERIEGSPEDPLTFGDLIEFLQERLHEVGLSQNERCPVPFCFCKHTDVIQAHNLFWGLLSWLVEDEESVSDAELAQFGGMYGVEYFQRYIHTQIDQILYIELVHQARFLLDTINRQQLFSKDLFADCIDGAHHYERIEHVWRSRSTLESHFAQNAPLYVVELGQCVCGAESYIPLQAESSPGFPTPYQVTYTPITQKAFPDLWMAISAIFREFLPKGQARVIGKIYAGDRLTSTDRNTKRQLRDKLRQISQMYELWEDLEGFI